MSSVRFNARLTRLIMDRHIRAKISGQLLILWLASTVRWWGFSSLPKGAAYTRYLDVPTGKYPEDPNLAVVEILQWVLLYSPTGHEGCYLNILHKREHRQACTTFVLCLPVVQLLVTLVDHVRGNLRSGCLTKLAGLPKTHQISPWAYECWTAAGVYRAFFQQFPFIASGVGLSPLYCGHFWPIVPPPDDRWGWLWSNWWNED
jgi:hypothetical protein